MTRIEINASTKMRVKKHLECVWPSVHEDRGDREYALRDYMIVVTRMDDGGFRTHEEELIRGQS